MPPPSRLGVFVDVFFRGRTVLEVYQDYQAQVDAERASQPPRTSASPRSPELSGLPASYRTALDVFSRGGEVVAFFQAIVASGERVHSSLVTGVFRGLPTGTSDSERVRLNEIADVIISGLRSEDRATRAFARDLFRKLMSDTRDITRHLQRGNLNTYRLFLIVTDKLLSVVQVEDVPNDESPRYPLGTSANSPVTIDANPVRVALREIQQQILDVHYPEVLEENLRAFLLSTDPRRVAFGLGLLEGTIRIATDPVRSATFLDMMGHVEMDVFAASAPVHADAYQAITRIEEAFGRWRPQARHFFDPRQTVGNNPESPQTYWHRLSMLAEASRRLPAPALQSLGNDLLTTNLTRVLSSVDVRDPQFVHRALVSFRLLSHIIVPNSNPDSLQTENYRLMTQRLGGSVRELAELCARPEFLAVVTRRVSEGDAEALSLAGYLHLAASRYAAAYDDTRRAAEVRRGVRELVGAFRRPPIVQMRESLERALSESSEDYTVRLLSESLARDPRCIADWARIHEASPLTPTTIFQRSLGGVTTPIQARSVGAQIDAMAAVARFAPEQERVRWLAPLIDGITRSRNADLLRRIEASLPVDDPAVAYHLRRLPAEWVTDLAGSDGANDRDLHRFEAVDTFAQYRQLFGEVTQTGRLQDQGERVRLENWVCREALRVWRQTAAREHEMNDSPRTSFDQLMPLALTHAMLRASRVSAPARMMLSLRFSHPDIVRIDLAQRRLGDVPGFESIVCRKIAVARMSAAAGHQLAPEILAHMSDRDLSTLDEFLGRFDSEVHASLEAPRALSEASQVGHLFFGEQFAAIQPRLTEIPSTAPRVLILTPRGSVMAPPAEHILRIPLETDSSESGWRHPETVVEALLRGGSLLGRGSGRRGVH